MSLKGRLEGLCAEIEHGFIDQPRFLPFAVFFYGFVGPKDLSFIASLSNYLVNNVFYVLYVWFVCGLYVVL